MNQTGSGYALATLVQRSPLFCANIVDKDPGRARQKSLATPETNFNKIGAQKKGELCTRYASSGFWTSFLYM